MTDVRMLGDLLEQAHRGEPWHGRSRATLLAGIAAATAASRPDHGGHSIWELVLHMTSWTREVARRVRRGIAADPEMGDWPGVGATGEDDWAAARKALDDAHADLIASLRAVAEDRLGARVREDRPGERGTFTVRDTLVGVLQHDAYHCGQIALLRRQVPAATARHGTRGGGSS